MRKLGRIKLFWISVFAIFLGSVYCEAATVIQQCAAGNPTVAASTSRNVYLVANIHGGNRANDSSAATIYQTAGTLSNLYIIVHTNDRGASTFQTRKVTTDGNLSVSIGASSTGSFEDTSNTDTVTAGDDWHAEITTGAGGTTFAYRTYRVLFAATSNTVIKMSGGNPNGIGNFTTPSTTEYYAFYGNGGYSGTESLKQLTFNTAGTARDFLVYVSTNSRTTTTTFGVRVNLADGNQSVSVTASSTGSFQDTTNTDSISVGDEVNGYITTGTGTEGLNRMIGSIEYETTDSSTIYASGSEISAVATSTTVYPPMGGVGSDASHTTESDTSIDAGVAFTASDLQAAVSANTISDASTVRFRINSGNGNQVVSITGSTTGTFIDSVNTDNVVTTDNVNYSLVTGATGTSIDVENISLVSAPTVSAARRVILIQCKTSLKR